jgi:outer membrane receptor protein involved in Fe transport
MPAGFFGNTNNQCPANQCDQLLGGNPTLKPETADTFSAGATFTPHEVRGLTFSVDWWDIMEYGFIGAFAPGNIFSSCALNNDPTACALIHRAPNTGELFGPSNIANGGYVSQTVVNVNNGQTMGIDFQGDYHLDLEDVGAKGYGSLAFSFNGTYLLKTASVSPGNPEQDCAGLFGPLCQTVNPRWRHITRLTWNTPWNALFSIQWRYIGSTNLDLNAFQNAGNTADPRLPAYSYLDMAAQWRVNTNLTLRAGVNNILDTDPPIVSTGVSGIGTPNTYPTYDLLGRQLFVSATAKF